jgi:hypothetical protein
MTQGDLAYERRQVPCFTGDVQIPFSFLDPTRRQKLMRDGGELMEIAVGRHSAREPRPQDPLTVWVTLAHLGVIEEGGPIFRSLDREERLAAAREVLSEEEAIVVETIAVPLQYRRRPARELEEMIRTAPGYTDRMWAGCWLILLGWTNSPDCSFAGECDEFPMGELEETIVEAHAQSLGVTSRSDILGWRQVDDHYETQLISHRLCICAVHYDLNGPPEYERMRDTVSLRPGWKQIVTIVPESTEL